MMGHHQAAELSTRTKDFLHQLERNNQRAWFQAHKSRYQQDVEAPAKAFFAAVAQTMSEQWKIKITGKIFRIYRDVRFSKDKSPYHPSLRMSFWKGDETNRSTCAMRPSCFFLFDGNKTITGCGIHQFDSMALKSYRRALNKPELCQKLSNVLENILAEERTSLNPPELKRLPPEITKDHPYATLWRHKGLAASTTILHQDRNKILVEPQELLHVWNTMRHLFDWLEDAMLQCASI